MGEYKKELAAPSKEPQVSLILGGLDAALEEMDKILGKLRDRLGPILNPEGSWAQIPEPAKDSHLCGLAERLKMMEKRIIHQVKEVRFLLDDLEI